jgi:STE20-related kinase adapter protein alpha
LLNSNRAVLTGFREATSLVSNGERVRVLHSLPRNSAKLINWCAPEVLAQNLIGYSEKSDIYSCGITCCEIANGVAPFADLPTTLMLTEKIRGHQPSLLDSSTFPSEEIIAQAMDSGIAIACEAWTGTGDQTRSIYSSRTLSDAFHKFGEVCMSINPDERLTATQLLNQHALFKQCRHTHLEEQLRIHMGEIDVEKFILESLKQNSNDELLNSELESLNMNESTEWDF